MRAKYSLFILFFCSFLWSEDQIRELKSPQTESILLGLGIQYLVPNQLSGFESTQMVFCPRLYLPFGPGHIHLGSTYGTGSGIYPEIDHIFLAELGYRWLFETRFFGSFISGGGLYSRYFSEIGDKKNIGPFLGTGLVFSLAKGFKMGAELRIIQLEKVVLGFGGHFTVVL